MMISLSILSVLQDNFGDGSKQKLGCSVASNRYVALVYCQVFFFFFFFLGRNHGSYRNLFMRVFGPTKNKFIKIVLGNPNWSHDCIKEGCTAVSRNQGRQLLFATKKVGCQCYIFVICKTSIMLHAQAASKYYQNLYNLNCNAFLNAQNRHVFILKPPTFQKHTQKTNLPNGSLSSPPMLSPEDNFPTNGIS